MLLQVGRPVVDASSSEPEYKTVAYLPVLGCTVSHNSSVEECFSSCHKKMWRVFSKNIGPSLLATDFESRIRWLNSSVLAIAAARWVTWPCSATLRKRLDRTQVHMTAILLNYKHNIGVSNDTYYKNRDLLAGKQAAKCRWSIRWATAVLAWNHHCTNPIDSSLWHKAILRHHDPTWLIQQRLKHSSGSKSKTCTRDQPGDVPSW